MKKLIKLDFDNTTRERKTENSYSELYSYDKNNGSFEFEILNDTLTTEQVTALFKFTESNKIWKTTGTVEGNKVNVTFDTSLITQNETVICYLYFDEEQRTSDTFRFKFKVKVSEIDKMNRYEVKERFINNTVIVDRLDVVTKDELKEALKNVGGIATEGLLTEVKAEELYAKKSEAVDNTNFELVKNRVLALELKTDKDTVYDDSEVKERLTTLENKPPVDLSNYATKEELRNVSGSQPNVDNLVTKEELENKHYISDVSNLATKEELQEVRNSQPTVDTSNLVTKQELEEKHYLTTHQDLSEYAKKSELYNDSDLRNRVVALETKEDKDTKYDDTEVKHRLTELENKPAVDTSFFVTEEKLNSKGYLTEHQDLTPYALKSEIPQPYNDTLLNERVTALESKAIEGGAYDDSDLRNRVVALESKEDKDTKYDDTDLKNRLTNLENKPPLDTSEFVTNQVLESKGYIKDVSNLVTKDELASKNYLTEHQPLTEVNNRLDVLEARPIVTPYNDTALSDRVTTLETKVDKDTVYNDEPIKERLTALENKPNVDLSNYVTSEQLENKHYLTQHQPLDNLVTKEELNSKGYVTNEALNSKGYLTEHQNISHLVTNDELNSKGYLTEEVLNSKNYLTEDVLNTKNYLTQHQDLSSLVTKQELENKHYLTEHQPLTHLATTSDLEVLRNISVNKTELSTKVNTTEFNTFKDNVVTKTELAEKGYLTTHQDLSEYAKKSELYNDTSLKERVTALEYKLRDYDDRELAFATKEELNDYVKRTELPAPYDDTDLRNSLYSVIDSTVENELRNKEYEFNSRFVAKDDLRRLVSEIVNQLKSENN